MRKSSLASILLVTLFLGLSVNSAQASSPLGTLIRRFAPLDQPVTRPNPNPITDTTVCTQDVLRCPDSNTYVSRDPQNNCQFKPCPDGGSGDIIIGGPITSPLPSPATSPVPSPSPSSCNVSTDINSDGVTNQVDLSALAKNIVGVYVSSSDLNCDQTLNFLDLVVLIRAQSSLTPVSGVTR